jgi:nitrous oxidase accessory protein NosD
LIYPTLNIVSVRNATIKGNTITNVDSIIFRLNHVTDSEISDNTFETLKEANDPFPWALQLSNSKNNIISNNSITGVYTGIGFEVQSTHNYVAFNTISPGTAGHLGNGIYADTDSNNNKFNSNIIHGPTG